MRVSFPSFRLMESETHAVSTASKTPGCPLALARSAGEKTVRKNNKRGIVRRRRRRPTPRIAGSRSAFEARASWRWNNKTEGVRVPGPVRHAPAQKSQGSIQRPLALARVCVCWTLSYSQNPYTESSSSSGGSPDARLGDDVDDVG